MNLKPVKVSSKCTPFFSHMILAIEVETMLAIAPGFSGIVPVARRALMT